MAKRRTVDTENPPLTDAELAQLRPASEVMPAAILDAHRRFRGAQKADTKRMISLRVDPKVLDAYKATGKGWQGRMHQTLAEHAPRRRRKTTATKTRTRARAANR